MKPILQLAKKISLIGKYIIYYLMISFVIVLMFAVLFKIMDVENPFIYSMNIFWGTWDKSSDKLYVLGICEVIVSNLFNIIIATSVLIKFLKPLNPIFVSKYFVYNTKLKKFMFRYWVLLPEGKFLYDTTLRVFVTTAEAHQVGVNTLKTLWRSRDDKVLKLKQTRGIRYLELRKKESQELLEVLKKNSKYDFTKEHSLKNRIEIDFVITGKDETGTQYYKWKRYHIDDLMYGFQFVPLQGHEYCDERFFSLVNTKEKFVAYKETLKGKKELFRYQHFNKLFPVKNAVMPYGKYAMKDILTKGQIIKGQYKGIKQGLLDFCSWFIMIFLDRSHWKSRFR